MLASSKCWLATRNAGMSSRERAASGRSRIRLAGRGKSGGGRVIYFYLNEGMPLFALMVYAKNQAAQLTKAQEKELAAIASGIKQTKKERT